MADHDNDELPQPFDAKKLIPAKKRQLSQSPSRSGSTSASTEPPRKLKRPGQRARITEADRELIRQRALERERLAREQAAAEELKQRATINDVVKAHYNSVPERGREWRKTDSRIKGLRSFNNWVKSCVIQKFSPDEDHAPGAMERGISSGRRLLVLDIGCGKGGDLFKWQQAPQPVELYVGLDPAEVSIEQARERYRNMANRGGGSGRGGRGSHHRRPPRLFEARFHVKDCYTESIGDVDIVRQVGFSPTSVSSNRGFDVVSMMFCMHYAFESEEKARQMLKNVSGALRKGGRFIGCIPNSDVISSKVVEFNKRMEERKARAAAAAAKKSSSSSQQPSSPTTTPDGHPPKGEKEPEEGEIGEDEKEEGEAEETASWGNSIYWVRFPGPTPADGVFRPPFGWKYSYFLDEAVEEVPEYVVPWEAFRALAEDYNLELQYHKPFAEVWETEKNDRELGALSERMGVRDPATGKLLVSEEEMEAARFYVAFCFYRV
ncbi:hypothetical protein VTH82DRAFT_7277 [Thermothelomyces myriococcoides]